MWESDAAYDTFGLSLFLLSAEKFRSLGLVKKRRGGAADAAAAARAKIGSSPDREGPRNPEGPPASSGTPGVEEAAAARAAMTGRGRVRAEESERGSNAAGCISSIGCCGYALLGSFIVVGDAGRGARSSIIDR